MLENTSHNSRPRRGSLGVWPALRFAGRSLRRSWHGGELGMLGFALALAVAIVSGIAGFSDRLNRAMEQQSHQFLAADRVLSSSLPVASDWLDQAAALGLRQAEIASFRSMVFAGDAMQLASIRAVSDNYPLRGKVKISDQIFGEARDVEYGPRAGEIWLDSRLFALLGVAPGARINVGEAQLLASAALVAEPDGGSAFNAYGSRALMNQTDLAATDVVQPGSQVEYRYLFAGETAALDRLAQDLQPRLRDRHHWLSATENQPAMASALQRAKSYLLLAACLGLALAGAAIAQSARRYSQRHADNVAIMKALGASRSMLRWHYLLQFTLLLVVASLLGTGMGTLVQWGLFQSLRQMLATDLPAAGWQPLVLGMATACVCCVAFAGPPLARLGKVSPLRVLHRTVSEDDRGMTGSFAAGLSGIAVLMYLFSGNLTLSLILLAGAILLAGVAALWVWWLVLGFRRRILGSANSAVWLRLLSASVYRRRYANTFQLVGLALALTALFSIYLLRTSLLADWRLQLSGDSPNYFLINIQTADLSGLEQFFARHQMHYAGLYPMVRGRISAVDGQSLRTVVGEESDAPRFDREMNLSWAERLPPDNRLIQGQWWNGSEPADADELPVSVESGIAEQLGLELGSELAFDIGGQVLRARVSSIRSLEWESMRPNFFFVFPPDSLENYASTFITSFYLPEQRKSILAELLRDFPTVSLIDVDTVLKQMSTVLAQLSAAIGLVLVLVLLCSLLVCVANVRSSFELRLQESALLRTLGADSSLLKRLLLLEFAFMGGFAGVLAALASSVILAAVEVWLLDMPASLHPGIFLWAPPAAALLIVAVAWPDCRRVLRETPLQTLQSA